MSASAVAKSIARLEDELGVRLFNRTTRSLALTTHGQDFYSSCVRILADLDDAKAVVRDANTSPRGVLRVILPVSFGRVTVIPALPAFLTRYPDIRLDLTLSDEISQFIEEGFDLGVRTGALEDSRLKMRVLTKGRHIVVAAPSYLARRGTPQTPDDLRQHDCIIGRLGDEWWFKDGSARRKIHVTGRVSVIGGDAYREAAVAGLGIAHSTWWLFRKDIERGALTTLFDDQVDGHSPVALYFPANRHLATKVRVFIDYLSDITRWP